MFKYLLDSIGVYCDAPRPWGLYFQDSAAPQMEGLVELHDNIMFYLIVILFGVGWILTSVVVNYASDKSPISHKYLNHGISNVPIHKCFNYASKFTNNKVITIPSKGGAGSKFIFNVVIPQRGFSTTSDNRKDEGVSPEKFYENADTMKKIIIEENKGKSGIYRWTNKLTSDFYIGQSINLSGRFINYYNISYLASKNHLIISRALIKYGYSNFSLEILEYCDKSVLLDREQYYLDKLNPSYNILKIAGSSEGFVHSEETKEKISKALKGVYVGEKSALYGRVHTEETKLLMSIKKKGVKNPIYGRVHIEETKELMRQRALARIHSEETKALISQKRGNPINLYEKNSAGEYSLIGKFVSARKAAKFIGISGSTVIRYMKSGGLFKDRYKFKQVRNLSFGSKE